MLNPSLNRRITGKGTAVIVAFLALSLTLPLAAVSSQAPMPTVSVIQTVEFAPPIPTAAIPAATARPPVVQRALPRAVPAIATASPAASAEAVPAPPAQNPTGMLSGTIMDRSGAVIPGVRVNMTAQSTGFVRQTLTHEAGNFAFAELPPDNYAVTADLPGFQQGRFSYSLSDPGSSARLNLTLSIAPISTVVDIATQPPPGLKCFSIFGAVRADGTPFTEADCPGGTLVIGATTPRPLIASPAEPRPTVAVLSNAAPSAIPATGQRLPIRVGGNLQAGSLLSQPNPAYPSEARSKGIEGIVALSGVIAEDGHLRSLKIVGSSNPLLETSVLDTIQSWTYRPTLLNGAPVEVLTTITLNFTMGR